jgi:hypothetical protein
MGNQLATPPVTEPLRDGNERLQSGVVDVERTIRRMELRDILVKEKMAKTGEMSLLREELVECVRTEGVNQFINCKDLRERYWAMCVDMRENN